MDVKGFLLFREHYIFFHFDQKVINGSIILFQSFNLLLLVQGFCPTDFITSSYSAVIDQKRPAKGVSSAHSFLQILVHENLFSICIFGYQVTGGYFCWLLLIFYVVVVLLMH